MDTAGKRRTLVFAIAITLAFLGSAEAQFHQKGSPSGGATTAPRGTTTAPGQNAAAMREADAGTAYSSGDMILPDSKKEALARWNPRISRMADREIQVWARLIRHSDGSYTESTEDANNNSLEQITKSANGAVLQKRYVQLDAEGKPAEVLIRDGRGKFKYRGVLVYDELGRFSEEQLFDADDNLIRRKVQEYTANGLKKPLRAWDYVENVPDDLKLVITRRSEDPSRSSGGEGENKGLFGRMQANAEAARREREAEAQASDSSAEKKRKGLGLGRLFGSGKN